VTVAEILLFSISLGCFYGNAYRGGVKQLIQVFCHFVNDGPNCNFWPTMWRSEAIAQNWCGLVAMPREARI